MGLFVYTSCTLLPHDLLETVPGNVELQLLSKILFFFNLKAKQTRKWHTTQ